jgi:hypothetical protein
MKKGFFILLALLIYNSATGQDIIYRNDGTEIKSSVIEITIDVVKYKNFEQSDGPIRNVLISDVFMIIYKDGTREVFKVKNEEEKKPVNEGTIKNKATKPTAEELFKDKKGALFLHGGFSTITGFAGVEYFVGPFSFIGGWGRLTAPISQETRSTIGLGVNLYLFDWYKCSPYLTYGFCADGAVQERGMTIYDTYNNYWVNLNSVYAGYRVIIAHTITLKAGAGYRWSEYTKGLAFEATAGIRLFSNKLK